MIEKTEFGRQALLQVLTWGLNEIQSMVVVPGSERRVQELANTLEVIPPTLARPLTDEDVVFVLEVFRTYLDRFPDSPYPYLVEIESIGPVPVA